MSLGQEAFNLNKIRPYDFFGKVSTILGMTIEIVGLNDCVSIGTILKIMTKKKTHVFAEIVGFKNKNALAIPFGQMEGIGSGSIVYIYQEVSSISPHEKWLGRVINAFAEPIDEKGMLTIGHVEIPFKNQAIPANKRARIGGVVDTKVKALNTFINLCEGQRIGIFSGSGVGKSVLMSMLAKNADIDVNVIGLVGERGREVQEFLHDTLGEEGLKRSVVIVATSDESPLMRRQAAYLTLAVAEFFRDQGKKVLCMMDSVTRFAMALREIGLSIGEPPTTKGYTPSVFSELPKLLERAGPGRKDTTGSITGIFTVLVEGGDHDEPISDAVRGILDGHIVMDRKIGERGRYPAIDILKSVSRMMPECNTAREKDIVKAAKEIISTYEDMEEMIRIGAYRAGSNPEVDKAIKIYPQISIFLNQGMDEALDREMCYNQLAQILETDMNENI